MKTLTIGMSLALVMATGCRGRNAGDGSTSELAGVINGDGGGLRTIPFQPSAEFQSQLTEVLRRVSDIAPKWGKTIYDSLIPNEKNGGSKLSVRVAVKNTINYNQVETSDKMESMDPTKVDDCYLKGQTEALRAVYNQGSKILVLCKPFFSLDLYNQFSTLYHEASHYALDHLLIPTNDGEELLVADLEHAFYQLIQALNTENTLRVTGKTSEHRSFKRQMVDNLVPRFERALYALATAANSREEFVEESGDEAHMTLFGFGGKFGWTTAVELPYRSMQDDYVPASLVWHWLNDRLIRNHNFTFIKSMKGILREDMRPVNIYTRGGFYRDQYTEHGVRPLPDYIGRYITKTQKSGQEGSYFLKSQFDRSFLKVIENITTVSPDELPYLVVDNVVYWIVPDADVQKYFSAE